MSGSSCMRGGERKKEWRGPGELPVESPLPAIAPQWGGGKRGKVSGFVSPLFPR